MKYRLCSYLAFLVMACALCLFTPLSSYDFSYAQAVATDQIDMQTYEIMIPQRTDFVAMTLHEEDGGETLRGVSQVLALRRNQFVNLQLRDAPGHQTWGGEIELYVLDENNRVVAKAEAPEESRNSYGIFQELACIVTATAEYTLFISLQDIQNTPCELSVTALPVQASAVWESNITKASPFSLTTPEPREYYAQIPLELSAGQTIVCSLQSLTGKLEGGGQLALWGPGDGNHQIKSFYNLKDQVLGFTANAGGQYYLAVIQPGITIEEANSVEASEVFSEYSILIYQQLPMAGRG